jgi:hypothetical protein
MTQTVEQILAAAKLYSDEKDYIIVQLPATAITAAAGIIAEISEPFCALIVDKDEVSLVVPQEVWEDFSKRLPNHKVAEKPYKLITFGIVLEMNLVGFMARISQALAEANVSILTFAAFTRDHFLVPADQFDIAMAALQKLKSRT